MDKQQAQQIIKETFENTFDKARFTHFIKNFLNSIDESKAFHARGDVKEMFRKVIKTYERIGTFITPNDEKVDILIVYLQKGHSLDYARVTQRNFAGRYLVDRGEKDAGLFAFVAPDEEDWRFSLVKMDYKFEKTKTGKVKVKEEFTPARRWSFLVGTNEKSHTAQSRLVNILLNDEQAPTLEEIEKAFDIETVTREFFLKYRELFMQTKEELDRVVKNDPRIKVDFEAKGVDTVNFAKKLLGQIVFLYFLQKKGWFGVGRDDDWGAGSKHFLRKLFEKKHGDFNNFFNDILEPLFYEALRIDRGHDDHYYSRFNCKIPFLNGGLFDPIGNYDWVHTDIIIPDRLFSNTNKTKDGDIGDGILDIFDRYNFTVKEDEPLDKEVAIDPELLGKAYEKFNAIRPDNYKEYKAALKSGKKGEENKFNKKFGVYYTPREIVHYMCQQSLINYLANELEGKASKEDIETLIHTGEQVSENEARIIQEGRETQTYSHKLPESVRKYAALIDQKLTEITVCDPAVGSGAFPVGMMGEIVKTRVVITTFIQDNTRTPYEFKRFCIENSIYGVDIDPGAVEIAKLRLWLSLVVDEDDIKNIKPLPNLDYKIVCGNSLLGVKIDLFNLEHFNKLEKLKPLFFNETNPTKKKEYKNQIDNFINLITNGNKEFDFKVYFSEVFHQEGGFDVVIANPPYGANFSDSDKKYLKQRYEHIVERIRNSFLYFLGLAYDLSRERGIVSYIIPNEFLFQIYMTKARKYFLNHSQIIYAFNIGEDVFEAIVPTCLIAIKKEHVANYFIAVADFRNMSLKELDNKLKEELFDNTSKDMVLKTVNCIFSFNTRNTTLVNKIIDTYQKFDDFCNDVFNGISTSCDDVYIISKEFSEKKQFEINYLKPCIRGWQFNRYFCPPDTGYQLLYITKEFNSKIGTNIFNYLKENRQLLVKKSVEKKNKIRQWHILFRARDETLFQIPKILFRQTGDSIIACLDEEVNYYAIDSVNVAILKESYIEHRRFLLGILNSNLINFIYRDISQEGGRVLAQVKPQRIRNLPIAMPVIEKRKPIEDVVDRILELTNDENYLQNSHKKAKIKSLEREIDQLVYKLYNLTPEEIAIVEGESYK